MHAHTGHILQPLHDSEHDYTQTFHLGLTKFTAQYQKRFVCVCVWCFRLELLLQRANKVQNMALECEEKLTLAKNTLQAVSNLLMSFKCYFW